MAKLFARFRTSVEPDPELIDSPYSQVVVIDGFPFEIQIFRLEESTEWALEIYDVLGISHSWDAVGSDEEVYADALEVLQSQGAFGFMYQSGCFPWLAKYPKFAMSAWAVQKYGKPERSPLGVADIPKLESGDHG